MVRKRELEYIHYDLEGTTIADTIPIYLNVYSNLLKTLAKIRKNNEDVYQFVLENVLFLLGSQTSMWNKSDIKGKHIIILNKRDSQFTIAHEIAHAWLNHSVASRIGLHAKDLATKQHAEDLGMKQEDEADDLAKKWLEGKI